jgi:electron transfer flavoprotein alpha subunit
MADKVWVYIDHFNGKVYPSSWETLGAARSLAAELGGGVTAVVAGQNGKEVAEQAVQYGADTVLVAEDAALADYRAEAYASVLSQVAKQEQPDVILFPTTTRGREIAAMAAVDGAGLCRCSRPGVKNGGGSYQTGVSGQPLSKAV